MGNCSAFVKQFVRTDGRTVLRRTAKGIRYPDGHFLCD